MAKIKISKDLILSIANRDNKKFVKNVDAKVKNLLTASIESLSTQVSYISLDNTILQPVNEMFNDSMVDNSTFTYVLGIENAQLDLNSVKKLRIWENLKTRALLAWQSRKLFKKKKRRKKRKKDEDYETTLDVKFDPGKYTVYKLAEDLQHSICNYLTPTSIVYQGNNKLEIIGKEDFGPNIKIVIYLVSLVNKQFRYYTGKRKNPYINLQIKKRYDALKAKKKNTGKNFTKLLRIFNALYYNVNETMPNQVYLESVLCFCPDDLFDGEDIYAVFLKIINYLSIKTLRNIPSITDENKTVNDDKLCGNCGLGIHKIINAIMSEDEEKVKE